MRKWGWWLIISGLVPFAAAAQQHSAEEYAGYAARFADCAALYGALGDLSYVAGQRKQDTVALYKHLAAQARQAYFITAEQADIQDPRSYLDKVHEQRHPVYTGYVKTYDTGGKAEMLPYIRVCKKLQPTQKTLISWKKERGG